jgi:hypothetical protein
MLSEYHFNKASFRIPDRVVPVYGELQSFNEHPTKNLGRPFRVVGF